MLCLLPLRPETMPLRPSGCSGGGRKTDQDPEAKVHRTFTMGVYP